jgi:hypothetical protein
MELTLSKIFDSISGTFKGLPFNLGGAPNVCAQDYLQCVAEGDIQGHTPFHKFGRLAGVTNNANESALTPFTLNVAYSFPASAITMNLVSTSVNDAAAGSGVRTIRIEGLKAGYVSDTEDLTLNGTNVVATTKQWLRINKLYALTRGTTNAAGTITLKDVTNTTTYCSIEIGLTQSRSLVYTVATGKTLFLTSVSMSSGNGNSAQNNSLNFATFTIKSNCQDGVKLDQNIFYPQFENGVLNASYYRPFEMPIKIPATCDLFMGVTGDSTAATKCTAAIRGWIE